MIDFKVYKSYYGTNGSLSDGEIRKFQSDMIIEETWFRDIQSCVCYVYDYKHDDQKDVGVGLTPVLSQSKISIDTKFIVNSSNNDDKTQVPYLIQFKPSQKCNILYYEEEFASRCNSEFPLGLYIDIPDTMGVYRRWIIYQNMGKYNQFMTWAVLPCNYRFEWIDKNTKYKMWGVRRYTTNNTDGVSDGSKINIIDSVKTILMPFNDISNTLTHDKRLIVSAKVNSPEAWIVSQVETVDLPGVNKITITRDKYNNTTDYIERDSEGNIIGMWADYYSSAITPEDIPKPDENEYIDGNTTPQVRALIQYKGVSSAVKVGGSYKTLFVKYINENNEEVECDTTTEWSFSIDGNTLSDTLYEIVEVDKSTIKFKFLGDIDYLNKIIDVTAKANNIIATIQLEIVGL